jgi:hypothetical protein
MGTGPDHRERTILGEPAFAKTRLRRDCGRALLFPGCTSAAQCVLPNAIIPKSAWSAPATNLLQYIPAPNNPNGTFSTSSYDGTLRDDKGAYRLDGTTRLGMLSAYYFLDDWSQNNPYPVAQGGANVPGFNALNSGRAQLLSLGDTKHSARPPSTNSTSASCATLRTSASRLAASAQAWRRKGSWWAGTRPASFRYRPKPRVWKASTSITSRSEPTQTS